MAKPKTTCRNGMNVSRFALAATFAAFWSSGIQAQEPPPPGSAREAASNSGMEDIVVTARFRDENLQQVPLSITAISGAQLEARGISNLRNLGDTTPNVTLQQNTAGFGKSALAFIRGVGQQDFLPSFEPGVGIYIDDIYHGTLFGALADLTDIGKVEVLRGPQGTLFGKNNPGGAIRISSTVARGDNSGYIEAGVGSFDRVTVKAAFDLSLVQDRLFLRVSGGVNSYNGYVKQIDFVCANPTLSGTLPRTAPTDDGGCEVGRQGSSDTKAARANLRFLASDDLEIAINADLLDDNGTPGGEKLLAVNTQTSLLGIPGIGLGNAGATGFGIPFDSRFISNDFYTTYATYTDPRTGRSFPRTSDVRSWGVSGTVKWKLGKVNLTSITGYRAYEGEFIEIWSNAPIHINDNYYAPKHDQFSQEIRLSGEISKLVEWTVGGYLYNGYTESNDFIYLPEAPLAVPGGLYPFFAFFGQDPVRDRDRSAFAHAVVHVTDRLNIEGGVRYSSVSKEYTFDRQVPVPPGAAPVFIPGFENRVTSRSSTKRPDYRVSANYQFTSDIMVYGSVATGFKGGGINPRPSAAIEVVPFGPEKLTSYEVGTKTELLDRRLKLNLSAFRSDYTGLQIVVPTTSADGTTPISAVVNAGKVRITGFELDGAANPVDNLTLTVGVGYTHFKYLSLAGVPPTIDNPKLGDTAPYVPHWQVSLGAQYAIDIGSSGGKLTPRIDWNYRSRTFNDPANKPETITPGYGLWNARLGYTSPNDEWTVSLLVQNLTDRKYFVNKFNQLSSTGYAVGQPGAPRTALLSVRRNFK